MFTATKDLMLPATVTGSWPRRRWYDQSLWGRPAVALALGRRAHSETAQKTWTVVIGL
jgi:hypothetical protein